MFPGLPTSSSASKDGVGAADNDVPFRWGAPRALLTPRQQALLLIMRGHVMDARRGENPDLFKDMESGPSIPPEKEPSIEY